MIEAFAQGDEVMHPVFGAGRVLGMRPGRRVRVRFDRQLHLPRTVRVDEVRLVPAAAAEILAQLGLDSDGRPLVDPNAVAEVPEPEPAAPEPPPRPRRQRPDYLEAGPVEPAPRRVLDPSRRASYRQALEALRTGVVPSEHASDYTVGRERELGRIADLLTARTGLAIAWGDYGTGKTHLLEVAEQMGLEANFLVSRITLDPSEVPPSHPQRLYRAIAEHLRTPGELETGLDPLMRKLAESTDHRLPSGRRASRFLSPYAYAAWLDDVKTLDWARDYAHGYGVDPHEGRYRLDRCGWPGLPPLTLSDYRTYGRVYVHLVGTIAGWARDAGYEGLLLLFDEVEFVGTCDREHLEFSREVLSHYAAATLPSAELGFDPEQDLYRGGHDVHRALELRYEPDQPLVAVFALTPEPEIEALLHTMIPSRSHDLWLDDLVPEHGGELVERIAALFEVAYPGAAPPAEFLSELGADVRRMLAEGHGNARRVVQRIVNRLDVRRFEAIREAREAATVHTKAAAR